MDGVLYKAKSGRKLHGFLFNDMLLLAEPLKTLNERGYLYILYREVKRTFFFLIFLKKKVFIINMYTTANVN